MTSAASSLSAARAPLAMRLRTWLFGLLVLGHLGVKVGQVPALAPVLSVMSLVAILLALPACGWATRVLATLFLGGGSWMLFQEGVTWAAYLGAFGEMLYLLAVFALVPVLSIPVRQGGYSRAIEAVLRGRISGVTQLNCVVTTLAFVCGSFMSLAAVPIMMTSMRPVLDAYPIADKQRFMAVSAVYGYVLPILWTPVSAVVGVVLYSLRADWLALFPILFMLSIAGLFINWLIFYFLEIRGKAVQAPTQLQPPQGTLASPIPRLLQMVLGVVLLVVCIALLERWLGLGLVTVVALASIPFAMGWSAVIGRGGDFLKDAGEEMKLRLPRMADQFAIFLAAGFFGNAVKTSGYDHAVNQMFLHLQDVVGTQVLLLLMPVLALIASFLGVHPLVAIALLGESLQPDVLGIALPTLAIALIGSSVLTYMMGPFSGTLGLVQSINQVSSFRLSMWNAPYAAGYFLLVAAAIIIMS